LLANGLAYAALFAIVPAVLLSAGVVGVLFTDPGRRAEAIEVVVAVLPPLRGFVETVFEQLARDAAPISIIGAVALLWGASRLAAAFDDAVARVLGGSRRRGLVRRNLGALAAVLLLVGLLLGATLVAGASDFIDAARGAAGLPIVGDALSVGLDLLPLAAIVVAMVVVYRVLPIPQPSWRVALPPGIVVGLALAVLARLFIFVAPRLVGVAALLGTLATVFVALAWLALSFQAILVGAAWVGDRMERRAPPAIEEA
jgi:YihY family inner membrane protein